MSVSMKDLVLLYNSSHSRLERANLWSHIENMVDELADDTYPNEYEASLYYDEDYEEMVNAQRVAFKKGYLSAIEDLNLNRLRNDGNEDSN